MNSLLTLCLVVFPVSAAAPPGPYITHISDTRPGQTMIVSGGGYDPATVRVIVHVPGNLTSERDELPAKVASLADVFDGTPSELPQEPPAERTHALEPMHATARSVFVPLPAHPYPPDYVGIVWLADGKRLSNPMVVNRPQSWFLLKTTSRPGELNRLCGMNLRGDRYVPRYLFLRAKGGKPKQLDEVARHKEDGFSESFCVQFRLPADLAPGEYEVFLHNNSGGPFGFTRPLPLIITTEPEFSERLFVATEHGLKGDSLTDNHEALQAIIDRAGEAGGGIVFLPPGTYRVDDTVQLREHVVCGGPGGMRRPSSSVTLPVKRSVTLGCSVPAACITRASRT